MKFIIYYRNWRGVWTSDKSFTKDSPIARKRMEIIRKTKAENGVVTLQQIGMVK
jgi:hypothetical protein